MLGKRKAITFTIDEKGCHICTSHHINKDGYPCVWKDGRNQNLHRVLYEERHGTLPVGVLVRHTCDTPACINDEHHIPGSVADNANDRKVRGRNNTPFGETRSDAKLTLAQVEQIKKAPGPQSKVAKEFGISQSTVCRIKRGKRWPQTKIIV